VRCNCVGHIDWTAGGANFLEMISGSCKFSSGNLLLAYAQSQQTACDAVASGLGKRPVEEHGCPKDASRVVQRKPGPAYYGVLSARP
jgi:hypothetical protein